jgi:phospholipid-binding lipoprotein MlaA
LCSTFLCSAATLFAQEGEVSDPIEGFNRGVFWVNDQLDIFVLEPVARGYDHVTPEFVQTGVGNFFENLGYPKYFVSDLVQLKFEEAAQHTGRFVVNTILGLGGLFDVATGFGLPAEREDFGIALAYHDVPAGPYLVLPILGPSNLRDGFGKIVDYFLDPITIFGRTSQASTNTKLAITTGARTLDLVDTRAGLLDAIKTAKESSVDYYLFVQGAYYQHRRGILYDGNPPEEAEENWDSDGQDVIAP